MTLPARSNPSKIVPQSREGSIAFYEQHAPVWHGHAAELGLTVPYTESLILAMGDAGADQRAYTALLSQARAAGLKARSSASKMNRLGNLGIKTIRTHAELAAAPAAVYETAEIPEPKRPAPAGAPAAPAGVQASLSADGVVSLTWAGSVARTSFNVERSLVMADGHVVGYKRLGGSPERPATDATLPAGVVTASYRVQAFRNGKASPWSEPGVLQLVAEFGEGDARGEADLRIAA